MNRGRGQRVEILDIGPYYGSRYVLAVYLYGTVISIARFRTKALALKAKAIATKSVRKWSPDNCRLVLDLHATTIKGLPLEVIPGTTNRIVDLIEAKKGR